MPRSTWSQNNFNGGEWSPLTYGRSDLQKYKNALATCLNYVPTAQGGLTRRPGTRYVAAVKNSANAVRLYPFEYSTTQAYVLEFGPNYVRFYTQGGQLVHSGTAAYSGATAYTPGQAVTNSGTTYICIANTTGNAPPNATYWYAQTTTGSITPYEVPTPYGASDIGSISFVQSADVLYMIHPNYPPKTLNRGGSLAWFINTLTFSDGPYLITNTTTTTLTSSTAAVGTATLTASSATGINNNAGFSSSDVGRVVRLKVGSTWAWGTITAYTSATVVTINWTTAPSATTASAIWRLGAWSSSIGYPSAVCFHQDRLVLGGMATYPNRLDASNSSDYTNFTPSAADGTVADSNALSFTLASAKMNVINWMISDEWGMLVGTASNEWVVAASTTQVALTPTNINAKVTTSYGSSAVYPVRMGKSTLFVQRTQRKLREMAYQFVINTFQAPDVSLLSEHLTKGGLKQLAAQLAPYPTLWMVRNDGALIGMAYDKEQEIAGWHRHQLGGYSDAAQTLPPIVESIAVIPSTDTTRDDLWMVVQRYVNGGTVRTVELMNKYWEDGDALSGAFFVDCGASYSGASTTTVTGLTWLKGQTVSVLADGSVHPTCVVDNTGKITLSRSATAVQIGLGYNSDGKTMRIEAGGGDGTAQGKLKRIHRAIFRLFQSVGLNVASTASSAYPEPFRSSADRMDNPVALYTGDKRWAWDGSYELEGQVFWRQSDPLPSNVLMVVAQLDTQDGG